MSKPLRYYVVTLPGRSEPDRDHDEWFEQRRIEVGAPPGTYGWNGSKTPKLGYMVVGVAEHYGGPHWMSSSWVYPTQEAAMKEARRLRKRAMGLARKRRRKS